MGLEILKRLYGQSFVDDDSDTPVPSRDEAADGSPPLVDVEETQQVVTNHTTLLTATTTRTLDEDSVSGFWTNIQGTISNPMRRPTRPGAIAVQGILRAPQDDDDENTNSDDDDDDNNNHDSNEEIQVDLPLLEATLVQEETPPQMATAESAFSKQCQLVTLVLVIVLAAGGGTGVALALSSGGKKDYSSPLSTSMTIAPTHGTTLAPTPMPTPSAPFKAFESTAELYAAVDRYLIDNSPNSTVAREYGHPIGTWDVSQLTSFFRVFDGGIYTWLATDGRNKMAHNFNEDISTWNVSRATNMNSMFKGRCMQLFKKGRMGIVAEPCLSPYSSLSLAHAARDRRLCVQPAPESMGREPCNRHGMDVCGCHFLQSFPRTMGRFTCH